jgi:hypothetical protein
MLDDTQRVGELAGIITVSISVICLLRAAIDISDAHSFPALRTMTSAFSARATSTVRP